MAEHKKVTKKFSYRRAQWEFAADNGVTLESILRLAKTELKTVQEMTFSYPSGQLSATKLTVQAKGVSLQLTSSMPGEKSSVVDKDLSGEEAEVSEHSAPEDKDFVDGEIFAHIRNNHIVFCNVKIRERLLQMFLKSLLRKVNKVLIAETLSLVKIATADKVRLIRETGVKSIVFNFSLYQASLNRMNKDENLSFIGRVKKDFLSVMRNDSTNEEIEKDANLNVQVGISFDGSAARSNSKILGFGDSGKEKLANSAIDICESEEDEEFTIILSDDTKISSEDITVSESRRVEMSGKSLVPTKAIKQAEDVFLSLAKRGVLTE